VAAGSNALLLNVSSLGAGVYHLELLGEAIKERGSFIKK
jgi:hypothetical protein